MNYFLMPWKKLETPELGGVWSRPPGHDGGIDLRSTNHADAGHSFTAMKDGADPWPGSLFLGKNLTDIPSATVRRDAEYRLNLSPGDWSTRDILDNMWRTMTTLADKSGRNRTKPLVKGSDGVMRMQLHKKTARMFIAPSGGASVTQDFTAADATAPASFTAVGTWSAQITSNRLGSTAAMGGNGSAAFYRHDTPMATTRHYAQVDVMQLTARATPGSGIGAGARLSSGSTDGFYYMLRGGGNSSDLESLYSYISGTWTDIGTISSFALSSGDAVRIDADGTTITGTLAATEKQSVTNANLADNLSVGLVIVNRTGAIGDATLDNFVAADLPAVGGGVGRSGNSVRVNTSLNLGL